MSEKKLNKVEIVCLEKKNYYLADSLCKIFPHLLIEGHSPRQLSSRFKIPNDQRSYAKKVSRNKKKSKRAMSKNSTCSKKKNGQYEWIKTSKFDTKYGKLIILKSWAERYLFKLENDSDVNETNMTKIKKPTAISRKKRAMETAPPILKISDHKKFVDNDGEIINIEIRGTTDYYNCYFKAIDVENGFKMASIESKVNKARNGYCEGVHHVYFSVPSKNKGKIVMKRVLFITFCGLNTLITRSHKGSIQNYVNWACTTLFTVRLGTVEQKIKLSSDMTGISIDTFRVFLSKAKATPCIYLICLGKVKDLKEKCKINHINRYGAVVNDNDFVYKFGRTENLYDRLRKHASNYEKYGAQDIKVVYSSYLDPENLVKAESDVAQFMDDMQCRLEAKGFNELVTLTQKQITSSKKKYDELGDKYSGHLSGIHELNKELKAKIVTYETQIAEMEKRITEMKETINSQKETINSHRNTMDNYLNIIKEREGTIKELMGIITGTSNLNKNKTFKYVEAIKKNSLIKNKKVKHTVGLSQ